MVAGSGSSREARTGAPASSSAYPEPADPGRNRRLNILIAEDNPGDVYLVRAALESHSIVAELVVRHDGEEMMDHIGRVETGQADCPDVILLDLNLPKYNGGALLERLRRGKVCGSVPVVVVTSSDSSQDRDMAASLGARAYFRKPLDFDEFLKLGEVVRSVMDEHR